MSLDDLLRELNINKEPIENDNGSYTLELDNSNEFAKYYTKLEKSDLFDQDDEASNVSVDTSTVQYVGDDFIITLVSDLNEDTYKMVIRKIED